MVIQRQASVVRNERVLRISQAVRVVSADCTHVRQRFSFAVGAARTEAFGRRPVVVPRLRAGESVRFIPA